MLLSDFSRRRVLFIELILFSEDNILLQFNTEQQNKEKSTDEDEKEIIFNKWNSTLLNSLFEENKSPKSVNYSLPIDLNTSLHSTVTSEASNSDEIKLRTVSEEFILQNNVNFNDTKQSADVDLANSSPNKMQFERTEDSEFSHPENKYIYNHSQETFKAGITSNLPQESKNLKILSKNPRPTLSEDSKLIKISLPTNPINLMQSNAQFLNKSRNFFNFITEKSTNIMERTLLPHHIAGRYNSILKLSDSAIKKSVEESCTSSESSSTDLTSSSETDLAKTPRMIDEAVQFSTIHFKDESGSHDFNTNKSMDETNCASNKEKTSIETSLDLDLRFEQTLSDNLVEKNTTDAKSNEGLNPYDTPSESQDNSPRPPSEEDSEADSSYREDSIDSAISKSPNNDLHNNPTYLSLLRDYAAMKKENKKLVEKVAILEEKNLQLETEKNDGFQREEIVSLRKTVNRLTNELKVALANQESMSRECIAANKEREGMVMKYAVSEKQLIDVQR